MNICSTGDIRDKEIINLCDGSRLGCASDFEFDKCTALVIGLIIENGGGFLGLCGCENITIPWDSIECIGEDTILVKINPHKFDTYSKNKRKNMFKK